MLGRIIGVEGGEPIPVEELVAKLDQLADLVAALRSHTAALPRQGIGAVRVLGGPFPPLPTVADRSCMVTWENLAELVGAIKGFLHDLLYAHATKTSA